MNHEFYMRQAFNLALKGLGHTSPNPLVGAVLVRDDTVLGIGFHQKYGSAHAEINAILDAKAKGFVISGATLYCNLEPCLHTHKKTPPCAPMIIEEKISQVVLSNIDPNANICGSTVKLLRDNGVVVITGVLEDEGLEINEVYFKFITSNTPFVHLSETKNFTEEESRLYMHALRQKYDCIMVGRKTIEFNNPSLTTRTDKFDAPSNPLRIVVGKLLGLNHDWKILQDEFRRNTMIIATDEDVLNNPEVARFLELQGVALLAVKKNEEGLVDLKSMMKSLASLKLTSILVEGGPMLVSEFLNAGLVDKISFFVPAVPASAEPLKVYNLLNSLKIRSQKTISIGKDLFVEGYL